MRGPATLRDRLALSAVVAATAAVLVLTALFAVLLERRLDREAEDVLRTRASAATATIEISSTGVVTVPKNSEEAVLDAGIWVFQGTHAIARARGPLRLQAGAEALAGTTGRVVRDEGAEPSTAYASLALRYRDRQVGTVVAAISLDPYRRAARVTLTSFLGLGAVLLVLVYLVARTVAQRALKPVAEMTRQAGEWSARNTSLRFGQLDRPGELEELAGTLDALLDRLSAVLRREQQLSAELSHELRTPLAGITAEAELYAARPRSAQDGERAMAAVTVGARRMERILDSLLAAARAESSARGRCDVVAVARSLAGEDKVQVGIGVPFAGVSPDVLERLLGPLIDNARRYGGDTVRVQVRATPDAVVLEVLDDGPGVPAGAEEEVFEPGRRLQPTDGHDGAGLGLPLARRLAEAAGGGLTCGAGPGGRFVVQLPRA